MYLVTSGPDIPAVSFRCLSPVTPDAKGPGQYERCTTRRFHRGLSSIVRSKRGEAGLLPAKKSGILSPVFPSGVIISWQPPTPVREHAVERPPSSAFLSMALGFVFGTALITAFHISPMLMVVLVTAAIAAYIEFQTRA
ncbi:hypothetical protein ACFSKM_16435 [Ancylobacter dichloromethanicus]